MDFQGSHHRYWLIAGFLCVLTFAGDAYVVERNWIVRRQINEAPPENEKPIANEENTASYPPPAITFMEIVSDVRLRYSITRVTSRVSNSAPVSQETTFHVILPETAFISGFLMEVDGKVYKAGLKEKQEAQAEYQAAVESGHSAAHVTASARDANEFTVSVNLAAASKITFNLTYEELLTRRRSTYEQAIHVNPGSAVPRLLLEVNIAEVLPIKDIKVIPQRSNDLRALDDSKNENDKMVKIVRTNDTRASVIYRPTREDQLQKSKQGLQGQFVVQYDIDRSSIEKKGGEIHVVDGYFVHFFAPSSLPVLPKHIVFVLDTSGSMYGAKMEQTKQAMESILDQLRPGDVFSVVEFSSGVKMWDLSKEYQAPSSYGWEETTEAFVTKETNYEPFGKYDDIQSYQVSERSLRRAKEFVAKMSASGGTNINEAMLVALKNVQSLQSRIKLTPLIIFLTDGEPTVGETQLDEILRNTRKANSDDTVSIYTLAFGTGADFNFLTKVSTQNRGFARKIYEAADATLQLKGFFDEVASPLLSNVHFVYDNTSVSHVTENKIANFFKGSELVVAGRIDKEALTIKVAVDGISAAGSFNNIEQFPIITGPLFPKPPKIPEQDVVSEKNETGKFSLEKIWAYLTIQELLKKRQVIDDKEEFEGINKKALDLSLKYGFVTPLTSLVVVKPDDKETTANVRPADGSSQSQGVGYAPFSASQHIGGGAAYFGGSAAVAQANFYPAKPFMLAQKLPLFTSTPISTNFYTTHQLNSVASLHSSLQFESTDDANHEYPEAESNTEGYPEKSYIFSPQDFVRQFQHNDTHVNLTSGNKTLSLSWQDELPDEPYQSCMPNYSELDGRDGQCKSIWKCDTIVEDILKGSVIEKETIDPANACIINDKYFGICCITFPVEAETENTFETTTLSMQDN